MAGFFDRFKKKVEDVKEDAEEMAKKAKDKAEHIGEDIKEKAGNLSEDWDKVLEEMEDKKED